MYAIYASVEKIRHRRIAAISTAIALFTILQLLLFYSTNSCTPSTHLWKTIACAGTYPDGLGVGVAHPFRIVVLTQRRHWSLRRLLQSINEAEYSSASPGEISLEIHIDYSDPSADRNATIDVAKSFRFRHGKKEVLLRPSVGGLQLAWFEAWKPRSDDERAVILEDDMELSPLWFEWLRKAWDAYGSREELGGISLCRQRLRGSDGAIVTFQSEEPFLYRIPGSFGFSPNARHWRPFVEWVLGLDDLATANIDVEGTVTTSWHRVAPDSWEPFWIWWCFSGGKELYTLYVHSRNGALIAHWAEPGVHAMEPAERNDNLLNVTEEVLENFPPNLKRYGWDYKREMKPKASLWAHWKNKISRQLGPEKLPI